MQKAMKTMKSSPNHGEMPSTSLDWAAATKNQRAIQKEVEHGGVLCGWLRNPFRTSVLRNPGMIIPQRIYQETMASMVSKQCRISSMHSTISWVANLFCKTIPTRPMELSAKPEAFCIIAIPAMAVQIGAQISCGFFTVCVALPFKYTGPTIHLVAVLPSFSELGYVST